MFSLRNRIETVYFLLSQRCLMVMCKICTVLLHVAFLHGLVDRWARAIGTCEKLSESRRIHSRQKCLLHVTFLRVFRTTTKNVTNE